jgi:hypothetical protein
MTRGHKLLCLLIPRNTMLANRVLNISNELSRDLRNTLNISKAAKDIFYDLDITPGFRALNTNYFDSLSFDRLTSSYSTRTNSLYRFSTALNSPLSPLARIWAKYLPSFDNSVTHSFADKFKLLMRAINSSYSNEEEYRMSFFGSILLIST